MWANSTSIYDELSFFPSNQFLGNSKLPYLFRIWQLYSTSNEPLINLIEMEEPTFQSGQSLTGLPVDEDFEEGRRELKRRKAFDLCST